MIFSLIVLAGGVALGVIYLSIPQLGKKKGHRHYSTEMQFLSVPDSPNCVMSTLREDDEKYVKPLVLEDSAKDDPIQFLLDVMVKELGAKILYQNSHYLHVTVQTRLMRYVDDVEFIWDEDKKVMQVRSCSRLGYSDMGANRARVEKIREILLQKS